MKVIHYSQHRLPHQSAVIGFAGAWLLCLLLALALLPLPAMAPTRSAHST